MNTTYPTCPNTETPCAVCPCVECLKYRPEPGEVAAVLDGLFPSAPHAFARTCLLYTSDAADE